MTLDKKIADAIALGVDHVRTMSIPPSMAQECARRWLLEQARDAEREKARETERAAMLAALTTPTALRHAAELAVRSEGAVGYRDWVRSLKGESLPYFAKGVETSRALDLWDEGALTDHPFKLWKSGKLEEAIEALVESARAQRVRNNEARRKVWRRTLRDVDRVIEERAAELDMHWTAALLTTTVALPSGERVPWGEATIAQHEERIDMLAKHAAGEIETASRHRAAVDAIKAHPGASCLNDLERVAA